MFYNPFEESISRLLIARKASNSRGNIEHRFDVGTKSSHISQIIFSIICLLITLYSYETTSFSLITKKRYNHSVFQLQWSHNLDIGRTICQREKWWMHVHFSSRRTRRTFAITSVRVIPSFSPLSLPSEFASYEFFLPSLDFKIIPLPPPLRGCSLARWNEKHSSTMLRNIAPCSFFATEEESSRGTWLDRRLLDLEFLCVVSFIGSVCSFTGLNWKLGSGEDGKRASFFSRIIDPL